MKKHMTDEQLAELAVKTEKALSRITEVWMLSVKTMRIGSPLYNNVCRAGTHIQNLYWNLRREADARGWPYEKIDAVFTNRDCTGFS